MTDLPPCSPWATRVAADLRAHSPIEPSAHDVCLLRARFDGEDEIEMATEVICALQKAQRRIHGSSKGRSHGTPLLRSYSSILLDQGTLGPRHRHLDASIGSDAHRKEAEDKWVSDTTLQIAPIVQLPWTAIRLFWGVEAPTVRLFSERKLSRERCSLLILRMGGATPNVRQSLRVDLPHILRLAAPNALVIATAPAPCTPPPSKDSGRKGSLNESKGSRRKSSLNASNSYALPFGGTLGEQCWAERWADFVSARLLSTQSAANAPHRSDDDCSRGVWCVARLVGQSVCQRRLPLLLNATRHTVSFPAIRQLLHRSLRYLSAIDCEGTMPLESSVATTNGSMATIPLSPLDPASPRATCLIFKDDVQEAWVGGLASRDGIHFDGLPRLVYPKHAKKWPKLQQGVMTHNLAISRVSMTASIHGESRYIIVGGTHRNRALSGRPNQVNGFHQGVWIAQGTSWLYDPTSNLSITTVDKNGVHVPARTQWQNKRILLRGNQQGCVEGRNRVRMPWIMKGTCEFDGRLSLVHFDQGLILYARANLGSHGQRFVQRTTSRDDGRTWSAFETIAIDGYDPSQGDVYFWGAQVNPVDSSSLIATFPIVHQLHGCIGLSLSLDGLSWSRITPLLACQAVGERALAHPAAPAMVRRGEDVFIYIHESVPGSSVDAFLPKELYYAWTDLEAKGRIARYTLPVTTLKRWTRWARRGLQ